MGGEREVSQSERKDDRIQEGSSDRSCSSVVDMGWRINGDGRLCGLDSVTWLSERGGGRWQVVHSLSLLSPSLCVATAGLSAMEDTPEKLRGPEHGRVGVSAVSLLDQEGNLYKARPHRSHSRRLAHAVLRRTRSSSSCTGRNIQCCGSGSSSSSSMMLCALSPPSPPFLIFPHTHRSVWPMRVPRVPLCRAW